MNEQSKALGPEPWAPHDLIVAAQHLRPVVQQLEAAGTRLVGPPDSSELLGLARLKLENVEQAADVIVQQVDLSEPAKARLAQFAKPQRALDQVLWGLRGLIAGQYGGWIPSIAKNRTVGRVHGVGEVGFGGTGDPVPIAPPPAFPTRASGPGRGVRVGVLDTGLYRQEWLAGGWSARFSDTVRAAAPPFTEGHATFVAGLILHQAPGATVEVRRVLGDDGTADSWSVAEEIVRFGRTGLDVLNLSFLCYTEDGQPPMVLSAAIDRLDPDLVVVAAAGNHGEDDSDGHPSNGDESRKPAWPAALDDVVAVGAADAGGKRAAFSPDAPWVDLHAPGVKLRSTFLDQATLPGKDEPVPFGGFACWSGTSFAAAVVSGAIAAGADPGRVTGRAALNDMVRFLQKQPAGTSPTTPMFLDVDTP